MLAIVNLLEECAYFVSDLMCSCVAARMWMRLQKWTSENWGGRNLYFVFLLQISGMLFVDLNQHPLSCYSQTLAYNYETQLLQTSPSGKGLFSVFWITELENDFIAGRTKTCWNEIGFGKWIIIEKWENCFPRLFPDVEKSHRSLLKGHMC